MQVSYAETTCNLAACVGGGKDETRWVQFHNRLPKHIFVERIRVHPSAPLSLLNHDA